MSKERIYENRKFIIYEKLYAFQITSLDKGTQPFVVCDG